MTINPQGFGSLTRRGLHCTPTATAPTAMSVSLRLRWGEMRTQSPSPQDLRDMIMMIGNPTRSLACQ
eukprot:68138-Rhodomonas_salina.1